MQFCIAYCGILSKHTVCATNTTGKLVAEPPDCRCTSSSPTNTAAASRSGPDRLQCDRHGPLLLRPQSNDLDADLKYITNLCDQYNIPFATNVATAEMLTTAGAGRPGLARHRLPQDTPFKSDRG